MSFSGSPAAPKITKSPTAATRREADRERLADSVEAALGWERLAPYLPA